jgi:hypothetical protein
LAVRAALIAALLLSAGACGGADGSRRGTPVPAHRSPAVSASPTASASATPAESAPRPGPPRTHDTVVRRIVGRRVAVDGRVVRIDADTVVCTGLGAARRVHGQAAWTRFRCLQPTFPAGSVAGPDLIFVVESVASGRLSVTQARLTSY